ncbi:MAG: hypothetical protein K8F30_02310 [Taibaiella sp.]|nr:hypothetical protein [Taibaiella sp.]
MKNQPTEGNKRCSGQYERVAVLLPEHKAFIVKKWGEDAKKKQGTES